MKYAIRYTKTLTDGELSQIVEAQPKDEDAQLSVYRICPDRTQKWIADFDVDSGHLIEKCPKADLPFKALRLEMPPTVPPGVVLEITLTRDYSTKSAAMPARWGELADAQQACAAGTQIKDAP